MKRGTVIGIAAGAVAICVAAGAAWWLLNRPPSAEETAEAYLRALSQGDADAVGDLLMDQPDGWERIASTFEGAEDYLTDYEFALHDDGSVRADVELAGRPAVVGFVLSDAGGRWTVAGDYLASLDVTTTIGDSVRIGGVLHPVGTVSLLPARYTVAAAPAGLVDGEATAIVTNDEPVAAGVEASLSPEAVPVAQEQLDVYLQTCAQPAGAVPSHCGIRVPWAADLASLEQVSFRIETLPVLALAPDARTFAATGGVLVATAAGTTRSGDPASFTYRADDWAVRGTVTMTGDTMTLAVD